MSIIDKVLSRKIFRNNPPVLVDIGASGKIHSKWRKFAKYSICITFDADDRETGHLKKESKKFKELINYNAAVIDKEKNGVEFYLTKFPFCSSVLKPNHKGLEQWAFKDLFNVEKKVILNSVTLKSVISELKLKQIDWFKTDSQGTDLRLFQSLGDDLILRILIAEFEPGIIDAYIDEDKLQDLMTYMDKQEFWMSTMTIRGSKRISYNTLMNQKSNFRRKLFTAALKTSPGWGEVTYMNSFNQDNVELREILLGWVFASTEQQYGFALDLISLGKSKFDDPIFNELEKNTYRKIKRKYPKVILSALFKRI